MIIQCPACSTKYVVPDTALGAGGRTVRCAKCRNSWHQDGPEIDLGQREPAPSSIAPELPASTPPTAPEPAPAPSEQAQAQRPSDDRTSSDETNPIDDEPVSAPSVHHREPDVVPPNYAGSQFDSAPPFRKRRNPLKMWTWAAAVFAAVALAVILAVSYLGLPSWMPISQPSFATVQPDLELNFPQDQQERRQLPNGTEFFGASGTITNTSSTAQNVPTILIELRDAKERIVYSWEVIPSKRTLAPGEALPVDEAVTDIPRSARFADIGWKHE